MTSLAFGINTGITYAVSTCIQDVLGFMASQSQIGAFGLAMVGCGWFGTLIAGPILDYTREYWLYNLTCVVGGSLATSMTTTFLAGHDFTFVFVMGCFQGFFITSLNTSALEYGWELTFPMPPELITAYMMGMAQLFGIILTLLLTIMKTNATKTCPLQLAMWVVTGFSATTVFLMGFATGDLKRERQRQALKEVCSVNSSHPVLISC